MTVLGPVRNYGLDTCKTLECGHPSNKSGGKRTLRFFSGEQEAGAVFRVPAETAVTQTDNAADGRSFRRFQDVPGRFQDS